jgi:hypothetical protein
MHSAAPKAKPENDMGPTMVNTYIIMTEAWTCPSEPVTAASPIEALLKHDKIQNVSTDESFYRETFSGDIYACIFIGEMDERFEEEAYMEADDPFDYVDKHSVETTVYAVTKDPD